MPVFTPLQIDRLVTLLKQGRIAPVYLFLGDDLEVLKHKARKIYLPLLNEGSVLESYNLEEKEDLKDFLAFQGFQAGLFGRKKVILVYGAEKIPEEKGKQLVQNLSKDSKVIYFLLARELSESHPIYSFAEEKGAVIAFNLKRKEDFLYMELFKRLKEAGFQMDKKTAQLFLSLVGEDYQMFSQELEKLFLYKAEEKEINYYDIYEVVIPGEEGALYLLGDKIFESREKAYQFVINLLERKIEPVKILGFLYKYFKRMTVFGEFLERHPELKEEKMYGLFAKKWEEIKKNPLETIPRIIAQSHPYPLFNMKRNLEKIKNFEKIFKLFHNADLKLKKEFQKPEKVFFEFFMELNNFIS